MRKLLSVCLCVLIIGCSEKVKECGKGDIHNLSCESLSSIVFVSRSDEGFERRELYKIVGNFSQLDDVLKRESKSSIRLNEMTEKHLLIGLKEQNFKNVSNVVEFREFNTRLNRMIFFRWIEGEASRVGVLVFCHN